jgi:phosphoglycolate phosphatase
LSEWTGPLETSSTDSSPGLLVLWDIDGTLLLAGEAGRSFYAAAFARATGHPLRIPVRGNGRLDPEIFRSAVVESGLEPSPDTFRKFARALAEEHAAGAALLRRSARTLPGGAEAIAELAGRPGIVQAVLTGNIEPVAHRKLAVFDLDRHLDLAVGAYGEDAPVRPALVEIARRRAAGRYRTRFDGERTVLVGDTIHDVGAARESGARVVAVASGRTSRQDLLSAGAVVVFDDLTDTRAVVAAITRSSGML